MLADENRQIEAKAIAEKNDIPYRFTLKILRKIVQAGIIKSYRGVNGGYVLNKKPSEITLKDVIETIDGKIAINVWKIPSRAKITAYVKFSVSCTKYKKFWQMKCLK